MPPASQLPPALSPLDDSAQGGSGSRSEWPHSRASAEIEWMKRRPALLLVALGFMGFFLFILVQVGYPPWRILVTAAIFSALGALSLALWLKAHHCPMRPAPSWIRLVAFPLLHLAATVTGGMHSPVFVCTLTIPLGLFVVHRWSAETTAVLVFSTLWATALALLPQAWLGPVLPDPYFAWITVVSFILTFVVSADQLVALTTGMNTNLRALVRAREQVATEALTRARDLELVGSKLSHELKNPLGAIKALVQLSKRAAAEPDARERLEVIEGEIERMNDIVHGYLTFSRPLEQLRPEAVFLGAVVDDTLSVLEARAQASEVTLRRRGDARVLADRRRLGEALLNLVVNALDASERGGVVEVSIGERDGKAHLSVRDTGRGMPAEVLARLGEPFFTTREDGTGLGVLLARSAFVQHGGALEYTSVPGQGTTATGTLPLSGAAERRSDGTAAARG